MGDVELAAIGVTQLGLVTRRQSRDHLSRKELESRLATGRLEVLRRGVYRFAGAPEAPWQPLLAACLAAGPAAVASHRSAAELWALPGVVADRLEVTVPAPMWLRLPGVRGHQSTLLPTAHCAVRHHVPVTTPVRTLVDLSTAGLGVGLLGRLVDDCLRRRIVVLADLRDAYEEIAAPGRRSLTALRTVLEARRSGFQPGDSEPELRVLRWLVEAGLPAPGYNTRSWPAAPCMWSTSRIPTFVSASSTTAGSGTGAGRPSTTTLAAATRSPPKDGPSCG